MNRPAEFRGRKCRHALVAPAMRRYFVPGCRDLAHDLGVMLPNPPEHKESAEGAALCHDVKEQAHGDVEAALSALPRSPLHVWKQRRYLKILFDINREVMPHNRCG